MAFPPVTKALIPMAGPVHSTLPLQTILGGDGRPTTVIQHQIDQLLAAGMTQIGLVVSESSHALVAPVLEAYGDRVAYLWQRQPLGFGHALWCAFEWTQGQPVLVQVCDHLFLSAQTLSCLQQVTGEWAQRGASVCAVQRVKESEVPRVGVVSGQRLEGRGRFLVQAFLEKPSVTKAELLPHVSGLGSNEYLCSAGLFVLTPGFFTILDGFVRAKAPEKLRWLAPALAELMKQESLYGLEIDGRRINLEEPWGLVRAQIALGLQSEDRDRVLALLVEESARVSQGQGASSL